MRTIPQERLEVECARVREQCACEAMRRTARSVTKPYEEGLASTGLRATQFPILVALGSMSAVPLTRLAEALAIDRTTLTRNLRILEEQSLVVINDAQDGRVRLVALTATGRRALSDALRRWSTVQGMIEERFGAARLAHLRSALAAFTEAVSI